MTLRTLIHPTTNMLLNTKCFLIATTTILDSLCHEEVQFEFEICE